jgi:hypothetical protein
VVETPAQIQLNGVVVIVGNYGSGKTEVAINLAVDQHARGLEPLLADLDLVNPYFRTREARHALAALGIKIILPPEGWLQADLPILSPKVAGLIRSPGQLAILDVGGDGVGAVVLAALADAFKSVVASLQMFQVVNPFRPNTGTVARCQAMRVAIESASRQKISGWIGNAHLMDETTIEHIRQGYDLLQELSASSGLPLVCMAVNEALMSEAAHLAMRCPILTIRRQLVPPWKRAATLTAPV